MSKVFSKEDKELSVLKIFINNKSVIFDEKLIDLNKTEPTDIRYDGVNYQITEGDKEAVQERRNITSKGYSYSVIRDISDIAELLLNGTLSKKSIRSDVDTILLIEVESNGFLDYESLGYKLSTWAVDNINLCNCWKEIYLVYRESNIRLSY